MSNLIYAIIALVALVGLSAWLIWRCLALRSALAKSQSRCHELQRDRAIRQNLQHVLERREAEIHRLRARVTAFENDYQEMESRATDLNMHLFQESGRRILAEKEDGVKRMKMEQLEQQLAEARNRLKAQEANSCPGGATEKLGRSRPRPTPPWARRSLASRDEEIGRLQTLNARRLAKRHIRTAEALLAGGYDGRRWTDFTSLRRRGRQYGICRLFHSNCGCASLSTMAVCLPGR